MTRRYFSERAILGDEATLDNQEAHHLLHVARIQPGDQVTLFDGSGCEFSAEVTRCGRNSVELAIQERCEVSRELGDKVIVGVPLPKGDRTRWLVEKLTELGVTRLMPLTTERSTPISKGDQQKLVRYVIEASKQCGRNVLMEVGPTTPWEAWVAFEENPLRIVAHPGGKRPCQWVGPASHAISLGFGPEGGLTARELEVAKSCGWGTMDLGRRILRIETAAVAAVSAMTLGRPADASDPN